MSDPILGIFSHWGEVVLSGLLGIIGWIIKVASGRHFESMDRISEKISQFGNQLTEAKTKLSVIEGQLEIIHERMDRFDSKLSDLEHKK